MYGDIINDCFVELDQYEIGEQIGKSRYGVVFKATDKATKKEVALKAIQRDDIFKTLNDRMSFFHEISVLRLLDLSGIVKLIGFRLPLTKKDQNSLSGLIIITELMKNGNLDTLVTDYLKSDGKKNEKINPTIRSKIIFGVASTMKQVHQNNVFHGDLKLENVFLDENLEPRIADFSLEKVIQNEIDNIIVGTSIDNPFLYITAPETYIESGEVSGKAADVYAFAFLIYKMFSNDIAFPDKKQIRKQTQYMLRICRGLRPMRPDQIPDPYWELIEKCWKHNPDERPTFEEITEELKNDKYAIEEFGMKTDLDELHEYQERIDKDENIIDFTESIPRIIEKKKRKVLDKSTNSLQLKRKYPKD